LGYVRAVSARDHVGQPASDGLNVRRPPREARGHSLQLATRVALASRNRLLVWSGYAWGAIGATAAFIAITCWWLTKDRSVPIYDAGHHLEIAFEFHKMLEAGNLLGPLTQVTVYPPFGHLVGALAVFVGGVNVASPIIGENLVFVPLMALGCYQAGKLLFDSLAGMLAVFFALSSPLLISMFHVFMLDAPLDALVAVSIWLILATEDFSRPRVAAAAGIAVGLGLNLKAQFPLFLAGLTLALLLHGGWRNWRGFAVFCVAAIVVGSPWYIVHFSELEYLLEVGGSSVSGAIPGTIPPTFSTANFLWYFWNILNSQLLAPLFLLVIGGTLWTFVAVMRNPDRRVLRLEFLAGGFTAWSVITYVTAHHDIRYGMPMLAYLAIIGTGWIVSLPRAARMAAIAVLALGVCANTVGIDLGVGREVKIGLVGKLPATEQLPDRIVLYSTVGFLSSAPTRDGDVPGLLEALHHEGVRTVTWGIEQSRLADFSFEGLLPLAQIAGLKPVITQNPEFARSASVATLIHEPVTKRTPPTCTRLNNGTGILLVQVHGNGVWVVRYDPATRKLAFYCPSHHPQYYDLDAFG
jgi:4-amino-4-deoxy-L-arabinose transferase-like glycosyltransferase